MEKLRPRSLWGLVSLYLRQFSYLLPLLRVTSERAVDVSRPEVKLEILEIITQYLQQEGLHSSANVLQNEANVHTATESAWRLQARRLKHAVLEGSWDTAVGIINATASFIGSRERAIYVYALLRQEYLELIDRQEYQKAFSFLTKRLKPLESTVIWPNDSFASLCYLLTCKQVQDCPQFATWEGSMAGREALAESLSNISQLNDTHSIEGGEPVRCIPKRRLLELIQQAAAYQIEHAPYCIAQAPKVLSLLEDYSFPSLPDTLKHTFTSGYNDDDSFKSLCWVNREGSLLAAGGSRGTVYIWHSDDCDKGPPPAGGSDSNLKAANQQPRDPILSLNPPSPSPSNKIWGIDSSLDGSLLACGDGGGRVRIWRFPEDISCFTSSSELKGEISTPPEPIPPLFVHDGDVYSVNFCHPDPSRLITAGHDRTACLLDIHKGIVVSTFSGHEAGVLHAVPNAAGNLIITGSRGGYVRFWDILTGQCIKTFSQPLGAVTSVEVSPDGTQLLSAARHGPLRIWDLRTEKPILRIKGAHNSSSTFLRASFAAGGHFILGGSACGRLHIWDAANGALLQALEGHVDGPVVSGVWNASVGMAASCGVDGTNMVPPYGAVRMRVIDGW